VLRARLVSDSQDLTFWWGFFRGGEATVYADDSALPVPPDRPPTILISRFVRRFRNAAAPFAVLGLQGHFNSCQLVRLDQRAIAGQQFLAPLRKPAFVRTDHNNFLGRWRIRRF